MDNGDWHIFFIMKITFKQIITIILFGCTSNVLAQTKATASASADVIIPGSLGENINLDFTNGAVTTTLSGKITFAPICIRTTSGTGNKLPATIGIRTLASIRLSGEPGYIFAITLPDCADINGPGGANMTINSFTTHPSAMGALNSDGTQIFRVSANLKIPLTQPPGTYTNATTVTFTVNYN